MWEVARGGAWLQASLGYIGNCALGFKQPSQRSHVTNAMLLSHSDFYKISLLAALNQVFWLGRKGLATEYPMSLRLFIALLNRPESVQRKHYQSTSEYKSMWNFDSFAWIKPFFPPFLRLPPYLPQRQPLNTKGSFWVKAHWRQTSSGWKERRSRETIHYRKREGKSFRGTM